MVNIDIINCLNDNYSYIIHEPETNIVAVVDPSEFKPVNLLIEKKFKKIDYILNTHHHFDHVGGNNELKKKYNCKIIGSHFDLNRIPGIDISLKENEKFTLGNIVFNTLFIPGHTSGHIAFFSEKEKIIFTGDTLFSLGCGRIFEGTYEEMFQSLQKIKSLPKKTRIYCGHEYTKKNYNFCKEYDPTNKLLEQKINWINLKIKEGTPTVPVTIEEEINTNIFLRCDNPSVKANLGMEEASSLMIFKKLRDLKDTF